MGRIYSFFLALTSTGSVAAWAIWQKCPTLWACIVGLSQVLHVAKPYIPFIKNDDAFREMSYVFERLYIEYERLWHAWEEGQVDDAVAEERFYEFREREIEIQESRKEANCPQIQHLMKRVQRDTYTALALNFG